MNRRETITLLGGAADSVDEANVAFRAAWERPLSEGADVIMLNLSLFTVR